MGLCEKATRRPGARVSQRWWEKVRIYLEGARKQAAISSARLETESEEGSDGAAGGRGEEDSQGASGSSGAGWRMIEPRLRRARNHGRYNVEFFKL